MKTHDYLLVNPYLKKILPFSFYEEVATDKDRYLTLSDDAIEHLRAHGDLDAELYGMFSWRPEFHSIPDLSNW